MQQKKFSERIQIILEAGKTISSAISDKLALTSIKSGPGTMGSKDATTFLLYDPKPVLLKIESLKKQNAELNYGEKFVSRLALGYIAIKQEKGTPYKAAEIIISYAKEGYGPAMYDIAMQYCKKNGIFPDRRQVSPSAKKIWDYYFKNRKGDVDAKPIDDKNDPITKTKQDDGWVHKKFQPDDTDMSKRNFIDYVYTTKKIVPISSLQSNHKILMSKIKSAGGSDSNFMKDLVDMTHQKFLNNMR